MRQQAFGKWKAKQNKDVHVQLENKNEALRAHNKELAQDLN